MEGIDLLAIDEAQNIPQIGNILKLIVDEIPGVSVLASGSSSFDLFNKTGEPLVGRSTQFLLTPFSQQEIAKTETPLKTHQNLETRLIYGSYPELVMLDNFERKTEYLRDIAGAYLLKDILAIDGMKNSGKMRDLLRLIAFQLGCEVSYDELGKQLGMNKTIVGKYLDLLEKVFVVYRLGAYSRNLRKEVTKAGKWYFSDNGIANAIIGAFSPLAIRQDVGALWENYIINCLTFRGHFSPCELFPLLRAESVFIKRIAFLYRFGRIGLQGIQYFPAKFQLPRAVGRDDIPVADSLFFNVMRFARIAVPGVLLQVGERVAGVLYIIEKTVHSEENGSIANSGHQFLFPYGFFHQRYQRYGFRREPLHTTDQYQSCIIFRQIPDAIIRQYPQSPEGLHRLFAQRQIFHFIIDRTSGFHPQIQTGRNKCPFPVGKFI